MQEHPAELDFDLMTMTGRTLHEYADMGWRGLSSLAHFIRFLGPESRLWRATSGDGELPVWHTALKTNAILADIYDAVSQMNNNVCSGGRRPKRIRPYPRPGGGARGRGIGGGAIPVSDFESWWKSGR